MNIRTQENREKPRWIRVEDFKIVEGDSGSKSDFYLSSVEWTGNTVDAASVLSDMVEQMIFCR